MRQQKKGIIFVFNGPNLNLLGQRDPDVYGRETLDQIIARMKKIAAKHDFFLQAEQSNHSGYLIDWIQRVALQSSTEFTNGIVLNAGGLTHTDVCLRDAVADARAKGVSTIEVHLSAIHERETFRHVSLLTDVCIEQVCGLGPRSYTVGLKKLIAHLIHRSKLD